MSFIPNAGVQSQYNVAQGAPTFYGAPLDFLTAVGGGSQLDTLADLTTSVSLKNFLYPGIQIVSNPAEGFAQYDKGARYRLVNIATVPVGDFEPTWHEVRDDNKRFSYGTLPVNGAATNVDYLQDDVFLDTASNTFYKFDQASNSWTSPHTISVGGGGTVTDVSASSSNTQGLTLTSTGTTSIAITLAGVVVIDLGNPAHLANNSKLPIGYGGTGTSSLADGIIYKSGTAFTSMALPEVGQIMRCVGNNEYGWITPTWTNNNGTVTNIATGTGLTGGPISTSGTISLTGQALAIHNLSTSGIVARTGAAAFSARTITAGTGVSVTNGDGVSGNPTIAILATGVSAGTYGVTSGVNYPVITVDATGRITNALTTIIRSASDTASGIVTTAPQSFAGLKTFTEGLSAYGGVISLAVSSDHTVNIGSGLYGNAINIGTMSGAPESGNKAIVIGNSQLSTTLRLVSGATGVAVESSISVSGYARSGYSHYLVDDNLTISLATGNSFFLKLDTSTPASVNVDLVETASQLWSTYRGGSFIITVYNTAASTKTIVFTDPRFKDIYGTVNDTVTLAQNESLTYSGMVLGTGTSDCDLYGIISDGIANLKV